VSLRSRRCRLRRRANPCRFHQAWSCRLGITGDTLTAMANGHTSKASIRELRNHGGEVVERAAAGERIVITRDGRAVAELRGLPRKPETAAALIERFKRLPAVDPVRLRSDVDALIDQAL